MRIYYIGNFTKIWHEECIAKSFEELGCEVIRRQENEWTPQALTKDILSERPDFVLFVKLKVAGNAGEQTKMIKDLKGEVLTVCWLFDPYIGYIREYSVAWQPYFKADRVFTTDGGVDEKWKEYGINHTLLRQGIYEPEAYMKPGEKKYDVIFVGSQNDQYPYRDEVIKFLKNNYDFHWFGRANSDAVRSHALNELYGQSKIAIDISVYKPSYWSNRFYETLGRGGFLISNMIGGLEEEFTPFKHLAVYTKGNFEQLKQVIDYYLEHDKEREAIRLAGFNHVKNNFTYKQRCQKLLEHLNIGTTE